MKSIKKQLLLSILTTLVLSTVFLVGITYYELKAEMDELFDENMSQVAHAIAVHDLSAHENLTYTENGSRPKLKGEEEFLIQIWKGNKLSYSSLPSIKFPLQKDIGAFSTKFKDKEWHYYSIKQNEWIIQISQSMEERHSVIKEIYSELLKPILLQLPILAILIWVIVGLGFRSLKLISTLIEQRSSTFLDKLPEDNVPDEVLIMVKALNRLFDRLSESLTLQKQFTADAAHELRTPLTAVRLELDVLKREKTEEGKKQSIATLYQAVERCTRLVQQLLELARQEPQITNENSKNILLKPLVKNLIDEITPLSKSKSIEITMDNFDDIEMMGQKNALSTMISNIVNNAILYTPENGKVIISAKKQDNKLAILSISDNGIGIPKDERERVFDRFYRLLDSDTIGSGLGLAIVKTIADQHNATITISEGIEGKGTTFQIAFPM